jgi:hypothetical protein
MEIPVGFSQINILWAGPAVPTGAETTFAVDNTANDLTPLEVATQVVEAYNSTDLNQFQTSNITGATVLAKNGPTSTGPSAEFGLFSAGTGSSASVPPNVSVLIQKQTAFGGRAGRGRMYWPGWPEANIDFAGVLAQPTGQNFEDELNVWFNLFTLGDLPAVLLHGAGSPLSTPSPIDTLQVALSGATQRRRLRR